MSIVVLGDNETTFRRAIESEEMALVVFRQKHQGLVFFELRDAEQAYFCLRPPSSDPRRRRKSSESRRCDVPTPVEEGFRLSRRTGGDTLVEVPMTVLTAPANRSFFTELFGAGLLAKLVEVSEPKTDRGPVRKEITVKADSEWRPVVRAIHELDREHGRIVQTQ